MKITDFEVGKKYRRPQWDNSMFIYYDLGFMLRIIKDDKEWPATLLTSRENLNANDWIEIKDDDDGQQFVFSASEFMDKVKRAEAEIVDYKWAIKQVHDHLDNRNEQLIALQNKRNSLEIKLNMLNLENRELSKHAEYFKKKREEAIDLLKTVYTFTCFPGFPSCVARKIKNFLNENKD